MCLDPRRLVCKSFCTFAGAKILFTQKAGEVKISKNWLLLIKLNVHYIFKRINACVCIFKNLLALKCIFCNIL
jgi:hypothetical protein